jgi:hypothetical protein
MAKESSKEIVVLSEREHILLRPTVYVGSVKSTDEKVPLVRQERIIYEEKPISVGMYKILNEVIDNSVDEAKRMKGKMKTISISINPKTNSATIKDTGNGFFKGTSINKDSGKTNIETAVSMLRAGSNFNNEEIEETLIGTNGMGVALTNVLSRRFKIVSVNETHYFEKEWIDFESDDKKNRINVLVFKYLDGQNFKYWDESDGEFNLSDGENGNDVIKYRIQSSSTEPDHEFNVIYISDELVTKISRLFGVNGKIAINSIINWFNQKYEKNLTIDDFEWLQDSDTYYAEDDDDY